MPTASDLTLSTLQTIANGWLAAIKAARDYKQRVFGNQAAEAMKYYDNSYDISDFVNLANSAFSAPPVTMKFNKVAEVVQLFGPVLYHDNPTRVLTGMSLPDLPAQDMAAAMLPPQMVIQAMQQAMMMGVDPAQAKMMIEQQALQMNQMQTLSFEAERQNMDAQNKIRSILGSKYLNYTPYELDLRGNMHMVIDEAIVKGMGVCVTDVIAMPLTGQRIVGSFWTNEGNYVHDPDWNSSDDRSCKWKALKCVAPVWQVERDFGLPPDKLKPNMESMASGQVDTADKMYDRASGNTNDLVTYYKVWSKMGIGDRLPGLNPDLRKQFGQYGDYVYLVVCDGWPDGPLNLRPDFVGTAGDQEIMKAIDWPIKFYGDNDWPMTTLSFHRNFNSNYPLSHIRFAIGEIQFMNWMVSMIAAKLNSTSRDILLLAQQVSEELETAMKTGGDLITVKVKTSGGQKPEDLIKFIQAPPMNTDIMRVIPMVMDMLDKRLGTNALLYGDSQGIFRSASEAEIKNTNSRSRIDAMAKEVNHMSADVAKKEFIAACSVLEPSDLQPVLGTQATNLWGQYLATGDPSLIFRQTSVRIEESSTRPPNRERLADNLQTGMQTLAPILAGYASSTGNYGPLNSIIQQFGASIDMDAEAFAMPSLLPPAAPGMPPSPAGTPAAPADGTPDSMPIGSNT